MLWLIPLLACAPAKDTGNTDTDSDADTDTDTDTDADSDTDTDADTDADTDSDTDADTDTDPALLEAGFEWALDTTGGCSDSTLQAWDGDGNVGLELYREGILARALDTGAAVDETLTLGTDDVTLFVEIADPIAINYCTDALSERHLFNRYDAISGTIALHMEPPAMPEGPGILDMLLTDVEFADSRGDTVDIATFSVTDVNIVRAWGG